MTRPRLATFVFANMDAPAVELREVHARRRAAIAMRTTPQHSTVTRSIEPQTSGKTAAPAR
jgi:hypothetical protein